MSNDGGVISELLDTIGSKAAAIAIIFPVAIALYAVGFFWDLPNDIIGLFDIGAFLFKASIVYLSAISLALLFLTMMAIFFTPIMDRIDNTENQIDKPKGDGNEVPWAKFSSKRKLFWVGLTLFLAISVGWVFSIDPPPIENELDRMVLIFILVIFGGPILRPFITNDAWLVGKILFIGAFAFLAPILVGHSDAEPKDDAPVLSHNQKQCPVIYVTPELTVADCGSTVAAALDGTDEVLVWKKEP